MSGVDLNQLRQLAEAATPGPWNGCAVLGERGAFVYNRRGYRVASVGSDEDATFIAVANPAGVLALLDALDTARAENERARREERAAAIADTLDYLASRSDLVRGDDEDVQGNAAWLKEAAHSLRSFPVDDCCPLCEEVTCDNGCPVEPINLNSIAAHPSLVSAERENTE